MVDLVKPWAYFQQLVCGDSFFASVHSAETLFKMGMKFISVVTTLTRQFPMKYLSELELAGRGSRAGLIAKDEEGVPRYLALVFVDRNQQYFIATSCSLVNSKTISRLHWQQDRDVTTNMDPERLRNPQPVAADMYYSCCTKVDHHNRDRSDTLQLKRKYKMKDWATRVNMTIWAMIIADCWKVYL
jgi:hypothetical protein